MTQVLTPQTPQVATPWPTLDETDLQRFADRLAQALDPERIVLFGSRAHGDEREDSDLDLLVILRRDGAQNANQHHAHARELAAQALGFEFPMDLFVLDADESARRYLEYDPVVRPALDHGKDLYVKSSLSITVRQWIDKSETDWMSARREHLAQPPNPDLVCFLAQQCAEKVMKAVLIHHQVVPAKTHLLHVLSDELTRVLEHYAWPREELAALSQAAVRYRYPDRDGETPDPAAALDLCRRLREELLPRLGLEPGQ